MGHPFESLVCLRYILFRSQPDRKVTWVWDEGGNIGKSFLANWLEIWRGAFVVSGGKFADIAYAYAFEDYVVFDFSRSQEDKFPYKLLEDFKNKRVFSPKYESCSKRALVCKLVVFANWAPIRKELSPDRWDVLHVDLNPVPVQMIE